MSDGDWIKKRIEKAAGRHLLVTESVSSQLDQLLRGQLAERQLPRADLQSVAKDLLARMVPETPPDGAEE